MKRYVTLLLQKPRMSLGYLEYKCSTYVIICLGFYIILPIISFYFSSEIVLSIPPNNFLIVADGGISCLTFASSTSDLSIIGNVQQERIQITIDMASISVGFGPSNC